MSATGDGTWTTELSTAWNIGESANGGYAMSAVLRALSEVSGFPDPISVTTHFLRTVQGGGTGSIDTELIRRGRSVAVARGRLRQADAVRLLVTAAMGDLDDGLDHDADDDGLDDDADDDSISASPPDLERPEACVARSGSAQGVELPIASRVEVRIPPARMVPGHSDEAVTEGWIRFADSSPPSALALPLFADAFPPSLFSKFGQVGWVPTIELTVHVRRRPADGWIQARFECDDLIGGRMIESGTLWDSAGRVVARSRQLGLHLTG
ncbi:MAG: thioesterase family protein [Ilumatobacteraceae bacterium]